MPAAWKSCIEDLKKQGKSDSSAHAICTASFMKKHGVSPQKAEKQGKLDELFANMSLEDLSLLSDELELELADWCELAVGEEEFDLAWQAPTARKDLPSSHFFWPERKAYPYRNPNGSVNCSAVKAAWSMAHGARSGKKAPPAVVSKIKPYLDKCTSMKASEDEAEWFLPDENVREFEMPTTYLQTLSEGIELAKDAEDLTTIDIQVLRSGTFEHPAYGKIKFDGKIFKAFVANFKAGIPQPHIAYDFQHRPDWGAAGWVKKFYEKAKGLWATVELTKRGLQSLKDREFIFFSTEYSDNYKDRETGENYGPTILGGGLTNRPFIKGMAPTLLSEAGEIVLNPTDDGNKQDGKEVENTMELKEILEKIKALEEKVAEMSKVKEPDEEAQKAFADANDEIKVLHDEMKAAIAKQLEDAEEGDKKIIVLQDATTALETTIKALEDKNAEATAESARLGEMVKSLMEGQEERDCKLHVAEVDAKCKEWEAMGIHPSILAEVKPILAASKNGTTVVKLSEGEGDDKKDVDLSVTSIVDRILNAIPEEARIDLSEKSEAPTGDESAGLTVEQIQKLADDDKMEFKDKLLQLSKEGKVA